MNGGVGQFARVLAATEKSMKKLHTTTKPRPAQELIEEMYDELFAAIYKADILAAQAKLNEMAMFNSGDLGTRIRAAKKYAV
jgi:hypothetical protein